MQEEQSAGERRASLHAASVRKLRQQPDRVRRESLVPRVQNPSFPSAFRGYDRATVDAFLHELAAQIAELETTQSSEGVVRGALEEVGEQTSAILQQAQTSADEITRQSEAKAEERLRGAEVEAADVVRDAERRARELDAEAERIWQERVRLIDDLRRLAEETLAVADDALERFGSGEEDAGGAEPGVVAAAEDAAAEDSAAEDGRPPAPSDGTAEQPTEVIPEIPSEGAAERATPDDD